MKKKDCFSYDRYVQLIGEKKNCAHYPENDYKNSYIPNYLYKYWSFDSPRIDDNLDALVNEEIWMPRANTLNDPLEFQMLKDDLNDDDKFLIREYTLFRNSVLSLTSNPKQHLMWSHYGAAHTGLCLEFLLLGKNNVFPITYIPYQVDVTENLKKWLAIKSTVLNKDVFELTNDENQVLAEAMRVMFYKKSDWKYEEEYRIIGRKDYVDGDEYGFFKGYMSKLSNLGLMLNRIILGYNCDLENKAKIMNKVNEINKKRLIKTYENNKKNSSISQIKKRMNDDNSFVYVSQIVRKNNSLKLDIVDYERKDIVYTF